VSARSFIVTSMLVLACRDDGELGQETLSDAETDWYVFSDTPRSEMDQVDRAGVPAVAAALIVSDGDYNGADAIDSADFADEIVDAVTSIHAALDDDLAAAGLVPCSVERCIEVVTELVLPDTLRIDTSEPAGFPNGRRPEDPALDVVLAVLLLDVDVPGQSAETLADLPLNPPENDRPFLDELPYLAEPHLP
jgi:hypothetical protein